MDVRSATKLFCGKSGVAFILCFFSYFFALGNSQLFSINPMVYEEKFGLDEFDIRLFLIYPTITCLVFFYPVSKAIKERNMKVRFWLTVFNGFNAFGSSLRLIPLWANNMTWIFHVAQFLIPVGVLSNALAAQMAVVWFPPELRGLTSSFVVIGGVLGASTLKTFGAMVTKSTNDAWKMFYVEAIAAVTLFVSVLLFCPTKPAKLRDETIQGEYKDLDSEVVIYWGKGVSLTLASIAILRGIKSPMFANMTALLYYDGICNDDAAFISSVQGFTPVFGACVLGFVMSFNKIRAQRRLFLIASMFLYGGISVLFSLSFRSYFWSEAPLPYVFWHSMVIQAFAGMVWGFMRSLTHEYIAELSFPTPPVYFGLWMELGQKFVALCVLLTPSSVAYKFIFQAIFIAAFISVILIWFTPPRLKSDAQDFNEVNGYGSSVWGNRMAPVGKSRPVMYIKEKLSSLSSLTSNGS
jgi:hypothetical protein